MRARSGSGLGMGLLLVAAVGLWFAARVPPGPRSLRAFEPDRMAELEVRMWQAYYRKERVRLFSLLVTMLHEQNRYPWTTATRAGFHLARAAATFGDARGDTDRVLPDLERAYAIAKSWNRAGFDPRAVARAELLWWQARRLPGRNSAEQVGDLIAEEYALLYEVPMESVREAGRLRAEAGVLRDQGGASADWERVHELLQKSFRALHAAVAPEPPSASLREP
jgi:hypothetical protein